MNARLNKVIVEGSGTASVNSAPVTAALAPSSKRLNCVARFTVDVGASAMNPLKEFDENVPVTEGAAFAVCTNWANAGSVNDPKYLKKTPMIEAPEMDADRPRLS